MIACTAAVQGWIDEDGNHSKSLTSAEAAKALRSKWWKKEGFGWVLSDVRKPAARVEIKGARQLWTLPEEAERRLLRGD